MCLLLLLLLVPRLLLLVLPIVVAQCGTLVSQVIAQAVLDRLPLPFVLCFMRHLDQRVYN